MHQIENLFIILDTYLNSSIAKNNNQQMLYIVFVSLMRSIRGEYIGKKATKNTAPHIIDHIKAVRF